MAACLYLYPYKDIFVPKPPLLWLDCTNCAPDANLLSEVAEFFDLTLSRLHTQTARDIDRLRPKVLCFDFDYPDQAVLRALQTLKCTHLNLPVLMLTIEHSEALAVWAFRARVWNYLVKPVMPAELRENLRTLVQVVNAGRRSGRAVSLPSPDVPTGIPFSRRNNQTPQLLPAVYYIQQHLRERASADDIAHLCGMNKFRFSRLFHSTYGLTFQEFLLRSRIRAACRLLLRPSVSITDVGCAVGFNDPSHFARTFKRFTGYLPSQYAERCKKGEHLPVPEFTTALLASLRLVNNDNRHPDSVGRVDESA